MKSPVTGFVTLLALLFVVVVGYMSLFTVQQTEQTIVPRPCSSVSQRAASGNADILSGITTLGGAMT